MKRIHIISLIAIAAFAFFSCSDEGLPDTGISRSDTQLQLKSVAVHNTGPESKSGTVNVFADGDTIGLYLENYHYGNPFPFAACQHSWWQLPEPVFLSNEPVRPLAYYPYRHNDHANLSTKEIGVEHISQTDYMHGRHIYDYVDREQSGAYIEMRHVLALVEFRFVKGEYPGNCSLGRISVQNAGGVKHLPDRGMLNLENGTIDRTGGYDKGAAITPEDTDFFEPGKTASLLVMPIGSVENHGDIFFGFVIDGRIYTWPVGAGTHWKPGMKYTYDVEMVAMTKALKSSGISEDIHVVLTGTDKY